MLTLWAEKKLIYLLRFYQIQGYEQWGQTVDGFDQNLAGDTQDPSTSGPSSQPQSDDSDDSSPDDLSLEAVRKYPRVAIEELGPILGLVLEDIQNFFERRVRNSRDNIIISIAAYKSNNTTSLLLKERENPKQLYPIQTQSLLYPGK